MSNSRMIVWYRKPAASSPQPIGLFMWLAGFLTGFLIALALASTAHAKWNGDPEQADPAIVKWYGDQHSADGNWCCDNADGHPFYGAYTFNSDGSVEFDSDGHHYKLPATMVLKGPNPTGHAVWWWVQRYDGKHIDYCFAPGGGF